MNRTRKKEWKFKDANLRFEEIFRLARTQGPQKVVRNNQAVVVVAAEEYEQLANSAKRKKNLTDFFAESPLVDSGIDLERGPDVGSEREEFGVE